MPRLPIPGQDNGTWGNILNDYLLVEHKQDGSLKDVLRPAQLAAPAGIATLGDDGIVPADQLPAAVAPPDADATTKGMLRLTGDLGGTADAPTVPALSSLATDASVVHLTGIETISGAKDFTGGLSVNATAVVVTTDTRLSDQRIPTDSSVTNAKVSSTAAIAQSKIANLTTDLSAKYVKPGTGIPKTDLETAVQTSLSKADAAIPASEKGATSGIATLDASGKLTLAQSRVQSVDGLTGTVDLSTRYAGSSHNHDTTYITQVAGAPEGLLTVASSTASHAINLTAANAVDLTVTANCTLTFPTVAANKAVSFTLVLRQDTTGNRSVTWPASIRWADGFTPTVTTAASKVDIYSFMTVDSGATWFGFISGQGM